MLLSLFTGTSRKDLCKNVYLTETHLYYDCHGSSELGEQKPPVTVLRKFVFTLQQLVPEPSSLSVAVFLFVKFSWLSRQEQQVSFCFFSVSWFPPSSMSRDQCTTESVQTCLKSFHIVTTSFHPPERAWVLFPPMRKLFSFHLTHFTQIDSKALHREYRCETGVDNGCVFFVSTEAITLWTVAPFSSYGWNQAGDPRRQCLLITCPLLFLQTHLEFQLIQTFFPIRFLSPYFFEEFCLKTFTCQTSSVILPEEYAPSFLPYKVVVYSCIPVDRIKASFVLPDKDHIYDIFISILVCYKKMSYIIHVIVIF